MTGRSAAAEAPVACCGCKAGYERRLRTGGKNLSGVFFHSLWPPDSGGSQIRLNIETGRLFAELLLQRLDLGVGVVALRSEIELDLGVRS